MSTEKFKVGDRVTAKPGVKVGEFYGDWWLEERMKYMLDHEDCTVVDIRMSSYALVGSKSHEVLRCFTDEMLELYIPELKTDNNPIDCFLKEWSRD